MDYKLAEELRNNGFRQCGVFHGYGNITGYPNGMETKACDHFTLEELIEACGGNFLHLTRCTLPEGEWSADGAVEDLEVTYGSTPREAVARLWLAIKKD